VIDHLEEHEIFVFGSNMLGLHLGGAARQATLEFGAEMGVGEGLTGQCYAFPTLSATGKRLSTEDLKDSRRELYLECLMNPEKRFLLTKVGCGIAGYPEDVMRDLFADPPANLILPEDWRRP